MEQVEIPTLLINALNDSFLSKECYLIKAAKQNKNLYLEMPKYGGHVGFFDSDNVYYSEKRMIKFLSKL